MSLFKGAVFSAVSLCALITAGCSTITYQSRETEDTSTAAPAPSELRYMRHTIREVVEYDTTKMIHLVNKEINMKEDDESVFLENVTTVLAQTVMIQPHFTEREDALRELKGRLDPDDYNLVLQKASNQLLSILHTSKNGADQAAALTSLTNIVVEMRTLKRSELKPTLESIAHSKLEVSDNAQRYAGEPMERLVSPSLEAEAALKTL